MTDNANEKTAADNDPHRPLKLVIFAVVCLIIGGVVLLLAFAPNVNPGFINECLFYPESATSISGEWLSDDDTFPPELNVAFHRMTKPLQKSDFAELKTPVPEDVTFKSADGTNLHGWFFKSSNDKGTVLVNWNGMCDMRLPVLLGYVKLLQQANLSVLLYDYRGFGRSEGTAERLQTFEQDGLAAYDYLLNERKIPADQIILMGSQLGAHLALVQNEHKPCKAIILETPWTNLKKWVDEVPSAQAMAIVPESMYPAGAYDNTHLVQGKHPPILVVLTTDLPNHGAALLAAASEPKRSVQVRSAKKLYIPLLAHIGSQYAKTVSDFVSGK